eukprot:9308159-Alexandrium_andersonii.AAC.1
MASALGEPWAAGCVDVYKCFDQVQRPLLYHVLATAGLPLRILVPYMRYHESLRVRNSITGGLG